MKTLTQSLCSVSWCVCMYLYCTWLRSNMNVERDTDTVSLLCILVCMASTIPSLAFSAGTKLPM